MNQRGHRRAFIMVLFILLAACRNPTIKSVNHNPLPPGPMILRVEMNEYSFEHESRIPPGRVEFDIVNRGELDHYLTLAALPESDSEVVGDSFKLGEGDRHRVLPTVAVTPTKSPGERESFAVDLESGAYGLFCFEYDSDGKPHTEKGMRSAIKVG